MKRLIIFCALCVFWAGCARIADPKPPESRVPEAVRDIEARRFGEEVILTFSLPERNIDGSPARTIHSLEIFRITEKADEKNPAVSAELPEEDFLSRAERIFSIPASRFQEYMRENVFAIRDTPGTAPGESVYYPQVRYAALFLNEKNQTAGLGAQVLLRPMILLSAPKGLAAVSTENEIRVTWTPVTESAESAQALFRVAYNIYRSEKHDEFPVVPLNAYPLTAAEYADSDFQFDKNYYYSVSVVVTSDYQAEGGRSEILKVEARDIFPPLPPENFTVIAGSGKNTLLWKQSPSADVAGYRIFRKDRAGARRRSLRRELITGISFADENVKPGGAYIYEIQAVDIHGNESETVTGEPQSTSDK